MAAVRFFDGVDTQESNGPDSLFVSVIGLWVRRG